MRSYLLILVFSQLILSFCSEKMTKSNEDKMYFQLNNLTGGKYPNNKIYYCILGYNTNNQLVYVDKNGNQNIATLDKTQSQKVTECVRIFAIP